MIVATRSSVLSRISAPNLSMPSIEPDGPAGATTGTTGLTGTEGGVDGATGVGGVRDCASAMSEFAFGAMYAAAVEAIAAFLDHAPIRVLA